MSCLAAKMEISDANYRPEHIMRYLDLNDDEWGIVGRRSGIVRNSNKLMRIALRCYASYQLFLNRNWNF